LIVTNEKGLMTISAWSFTDAIDEYVRQNSKSKAAYDRACLILPSGCTHNVLYYPPFPLYPAAGRGTRIWDMDGNERIDFNFNTTLIRARTKIQNSDATLCRFV